MRIASSIRTPSTGWIDKWPYALLSGGSMVDFLILPAEEGDDGIDGSFIVLEFSFVAFGFTLVAEELFILLPWFRTRKLNGTFLRNSDVLRRQWTRIDKRYKLCLQENHSDYIVKGSTLVRLNRDDKFQIHISQKVSKAFIYSKEIQLCLLSVCASV